MVDLISTELLLLPWPVNNLNPCCLAWNLSYPISSFFSLLYIICACEFISVPVTFLQESRYLENFVACVIARWLHDHPCSSHQFGVQVTIGSFAV